MEEPPTPEAEKTMQIMQKGKSTAPDKIQLEVFEALDDLRLEQMIKVLNSILDLRKILQKLCISIFITLSVSEKLKARKYEYHCTISLQKMMEEEESILSGLMDEPRKHLYQQASIHPIIKQKPKPYRKLH